MGESRDPINSPQRREFLDHDGRAQPDEDEGEHDVGNTELGLFVHESFLARHGEPRDYVLLQDASWPASTAKPPRWRR